MSLPPIFNLLVIDDDRLIHDSIRLSLPKNWRMVGFTQTPAMPLQEMFHAAFVDMHLLPGRPATGPELIEKLATPNPQLEIIGMSGDLSMDLMETCLHKGASKFLAKPLVTDEIQSTLEKIEALWSMRDHSINHVGEKFRWVGKGTKSLEVLRQVASLRGEPGPILIEGETGTGKEVVFRLLNQQEPHRIAVAVNVAAIPENLFESEFFGHMKGAFTGADHLKIGLAEAAHGGDLFLDEIEALPLNQQVKLLRFLESGEVRKVGAKESSFVKVRSIIASNQSLTKLISEGKFREDLYFRISGKKIQLPPLRERTDDISELAQFFLSLQRPRSMKSFSPEAVEELKNYSWTGNVRELKRICEQLALICPLPIIRREDVAALISAAVGIGGNEALQLNKGLATLVEEFEAKVIRLCLQQTNDIEKAGEILKISRSSLYKKIKDYQLQEVSPQGGL